MAEGAGPVDVCCANLLLRLQGLLIKRGVPAVPLGVYLHLALTENLFGYATHKSSFKKQPAKAIERGVGFR